MPPSNSLTIFLPILLHHGFELQSRAHQHLCELPLVVVQALYLLYPPGQRVYYLARPRLSAHPHHPSPAVLPYSFLRLSHADILRPSSRSPTHLQLTQSSTALPFSHLDTLAPSFRCPSLLTLQLLVCSPVFSQKRCTIVVHTR